MSETPETTTEFSADTNTQSYEFQAEANKVLKLVIHSLYTNKEVFLREVISNSADAINKLKYQLLLNPELLNTETDFKILISVNSTEKTLSIIDNGIGMSRDELVENLGTIAKSGTEQLKNSLSSNEGIEGLIGQFGVGFYSVFMVAKNVTVKSKKAGSNEAWAWYSDGESSYTISRGDIKEEFGTEVILQLREEESQYLDKFRLEHIITTYSNYIAYPIEIKIDEASSEKVNSGIALWTKPKNQVTTAEYSEFFRNVAHVGGEPWLILHNKNEGNLEYINLLYIPLVKPFDLFHPDRKCAIKLYINKVFITEDNVQIIPAYLRFLRGVVDCMELPLNISRETLQNNKVINKIKQSLTKKVINELHKKLAGDSADYDKNFWGNFGPVIKEGLCEASPSEERESLLGLCRFYSLNKQTLVSLDEYIANFLNEQKEIYYLSGNNLEALKADPKLEGFISRGIDVLLFTDAVDDFWTNVANEYKECKLVSATRSDINLDNFSPLETNTPQVEVSDDKAAECITYFKDILKDKVSDVIISKKLNNSPVCLAIKEGAMDIRMERFMLEQKQLHSKTKKVLEVNMKHPIIRHIMEHKNVQTADIVNLLFDQACIIEGEPLENTTAFCQRLNSIIMDFKLEA